MAENEVPQEEKQEPVFKKPTTRYKAVTGLPEAGGVAMADMYGSYVIKDATGNPKEKREFKVMLSARANTAAQALENLVDAITQGKMGVEEFMAVTGLSVVGRPGTVAPAPKSAAPVASAPVPAPVGAPAPAPAPAGVPAGVATTGGEFIISYIEFKPRPDKKVEVSFFGNDKKQPHNQYPYLNWVTDPTYIPAKFANVAGFTPDMFTGAMAYDLPCKLFWTPGSLNKSGQPYKNIDRIEPA